MHAKHRPVIDVCTRVIVKHTPVIAMRTGVIDVCTGVIDGCMGVIVKCTYAIPMYSPAIAVGGGAIAAVAGEPWLQGLELWWGDRPPAYPTSRGLCTPRPPRLSTWVK